MRSRVVFTKRFPSTAAALKWLRKDIAQYKSQPLTPEGWLQDRPTWEVIEGGKTVLTVDEWGIEEAA